MACNCGKRSSSAPLGMGGSTGGNNGFAKTYTLTTPDGKTQTFGSRLEAEAARVKFGGGTITS